MDLGKTMSIIYIALLCLLLVIGLFMLAIHIGFRATREPNQRTPLDFNLLYDVLSIHTNHQAKLAAWWIKGQSKHSIILIHGWGANKSALLPLASALHKTGLNILMLDAHNHGDSDKRGTPSMPKFAEDIEFALHWLKTHQSKLCQKCFVLGHSVGAAATILSASRNNQADGYISIASFAHPKLMMQRHLKKIAKFPIIVKIINHYVQWVIGYSFDDIAPVNNLQKITKPVLCLHGNQDTVIPVSDFYMLCQSNHKNLECSEIPEADHDSIELIQQHFHKIENFIQAILNKTP